MGEVKNNSKQAVVIMVGVLLALTVFGSFVEIETAADESFRYLRF